MGRPVPGKSGDQAGSPGASAESPGPVLVAQEGHIQEVGWGFQLAALWEAASLQSRRRLRPQCRDATWGVSRGGHVPEDTETAPRQCVEDVEPYPQGAVPVLTEEPIRRHGRIGAESDGTRFGSLLRGSHGSEPG